MTQFIPPNYNLLKYELSNSTLSTDQLYKFYSILGRKYVNHRKELWDWFESFNENQLLCIQVKRDDNNSWYRYRIAADRIYTPSTIIAKHKDDSNDYFLSQDDDL